MAALAPCGAGCEEGGAILGARGMCDVTTDRCICPPGFSGNGPWTVRNDCSVNERLVHGGAAVMVAGAVVVAVAGVVTLVFLLDWWGLVRFRSGPRVEEGNHVAVPGEVASVEIGSRVDKVNWEVSSQAGQGYVGAAIGRKNKSSSSKSALAATAQNDRGSNSSASGAAAVETINPKGGAAPRYAGSSSSAAAAAAAAAAATRRLRGGPRRTGRASAFSKYDSELWRTRRDLLTCVVCTVFFGISCTVCMSQVVSGVRRHEGNAVYDFALASASATFFGSLWHVVVWHRNVPRYMYAESRILLRYPLLVSRASVVFTVLMVALSFLFLFVLPRMSGELRELGGMLWAASATVYLVCFDLFFTSVLLTLRALFSELATGRVSTYSRSARDVRYKDILRTTTRCLAVCNVVTPLGIVALVLVVTSPSQDVFLGLLMSSAFVVSLLMCHISAFRLAGKRE